LEAELAELAGRVAGLARAHRERLAGADPQIKAGLQDVANQLHSLAGALQAGVQPAPA
jgi:hypothetical protein